MFLELRADWIRALLVSKVLATVITFASGFSAFIVAEVTTQNAWIGIAFTAVATTVVGIFVNYPRLIKARGEDWASIVRELRAQNALAVAALERRVAYQNRERVLMRASKHKLAGMIQVAHDHITLLEWVLKEHKIQHDRFNRSHLSDAFIEEDEEMKALTVLQLNDLADNPVE